MKDFSCNLFFIKSLKRGDEDAYVFLVNKFHANLSTYILSLTNDRTLTQDIVQNVFLKTWEFRKKLNSEYSIKNFLYKSAYNEFVNQYWKNQTLKDLELKYVKSINESKEEFDNETFTKLILMVKKEIQNLPPKCKQVFLLSKEEGLTNIEISDYLYLSKRTVETQISKAYSIIRKKIGCKTNYILFFMFGLHNKLVLPLSESIEVNNEKHRRFL